jgi:four helix bundle protein
MRVTIKRRGEVAQKRFFFEDLAVWQKAVEFTSAIIDLIEQIDTSRKHYRLIEQLESASASIALNIAEGKGRFSKKEFIQFLYIARGSLYETITLLKIFNKKSWITNDQLEKAENSADEIGKMLSGLIKSIRLTLG